MMVGDGPQGQPTEGVATLTDLADMAFEAETPEAEGDADEGEEGEEAPEVEGEESAEEESDESEEQEEEATFTITVNGKEITLKHSEMVEMAQKGADYSQKTMAVAEERKAVESAKAQADQSRQHAEQALTEQLNRLQALEQFYESQLGDPPPIEWAQQDAAYYLAQKELYESRKGQLAQAQTAIQKLQHDQQRQRQAWIVQQADATEKALRDTLPGWNDDTLTTLAEYAGKHGLNPQTVDIAFVQKGLWEVLHKAKAYDALQAQKAQLKPKTQLPKVQKPGGNNQPNRGEARHADALKRHKAKPSINTLADLMD